MEKARKAAKLLNSLSVYRGVRNDRVFSAYCSLLDALDDETDSFLKKWGAFFDILCCEGSAESLSSSLMDAMLFDENFFAKAAALGKTDSLSQCEVKAVKRDIGAIAQACQLTAEDIISSQKYSEEIAEIADTLPKWETGSEADDLLDTEKTFDVLSQHYRKNGYGIYAGYRAFIWRNGSIKPVPYPDPITVDELIGYSSCREQVIRNTAAFLKGVKSNNVLLYGDRGTGKSSTVKAVLNKYYKDGLRLVEMPKESLSEFPMLVEKIARIPLYFIIFIDDLSFSSDDSSYASLKAVLEGGIAARPDNTLIYATSNRRHLIKENFRDRDGDDLHRNDTVQETMSLYDRFGLAVNFGQPDKEAYLEIVAGLAKKYNVNINESLIKEAEKWAIMRGGRSPRCALQFISSIMGSV